MSTERNRQLPSIFCCPLVAACLPGMFSLVLLLQQIIYCYHQITANRAHVCPDCLLVTYFTLFSFSSGNGTTQRKSISICIVCLFGGDEKSLNL